MAQFLVGIDIGTHTTRVVVAEPGPTPEHAPTILGTGMSETSGVRHGYVTNLHEATKSIRLAIRDAEEHAKVRIKKAYVSIGGISLSSDTISSSTIISKADGEITDRDVELVLADAEQSMLKNSKNRRIIYSTAVSYKIDGKDVLGHPLGMAGVKLEASVLFITCLVHHFEDLMHAVIDAGVDVIDVIPSVIAQSNAVLSQRQKIVGCLLVDIGAETVSMAVFENDLPLSLEVFQIGSTDITHDIALGFQIPLEHAEKVKRGAHDSNLPQDKLDDIIFKRLSDIFELISLHLKKIGRNGLLPAGAVITGGGSSLTSLEAFSKQTLRLPSTVINVRHVQSLNKHRIFDSSWFIAYGLTFIETHHDNHRPSSRIVASQGFRGIKTFLNNFLP